jgi:hypothetical protein
MKRRTPAIVLLLISVLLFPADTRATVVIFAVTKDRILLATDGLATHTVRGKSGATNAKECKIERAGMSLFVDIGLENYPPTGLNVPTLVRRAFTDADLRKNIKNFIRIATPAIMKAWNDIKQNDQNLYRLMASTKGSPPGTELVATGSIDGVLTVVVLEYSDNGTGLVRKAPQYFDGTRGTQYQEIGEYGAIDAYRKTHPEVDKLDDIPWIEKLLNVEFDAQPQSGWKKVGPPISLVEMNKIAGTVWHCQGACGSKPTRGETKR